MSAPAKPALSVVVPVLDEAARIRSRLADLVGRPGIDQVVVVDGGSRDDTAALAAQVPGVTVCRTTRGRGSQLAAGARLAWGDVLLFLHIDCRLPADAPGQIHRTLARPGTVAGAFRTRHVLDGGGGRWMRPLLPLADLRSHYTRLPYGDQALFVCADAYRRAGGFARMALFEDVDLAKRLWAVGRIEVLPDRVEVSARRYVARPVWTAIAMNAFPVLWRIGVPEDRLARWYASAR